MHTPRTPPDRRKEKGRLPLEVAMPSSQLEETILLEVKRKQENEEGAYIKSGAQCPRVQK